MERVPVWVSARDPISEAGVVSQLRPRPEVRIVGRDEDDDALVAVVISDALDADTLRMLRAVQRKGFTRTVLVVGQVDEGAGHLPQADVARRRLVEVAVAAQERHQRVEVVVGSGPDAHRAHPIRFRGTR